MLWGVLLSLAALLCACCQKPADIAIDYESTQYILSLSKEYEDKSLLILIGKDGEISQTVPYDGQGMNSITRFEDSLYLHSARKNRHFRITDQGNWQTFSYEKNEVETSEDAPSWFTAIGQESLIETMNIGFVNNHYESAIMYTQDDQKRTVRIEDRCLESAIDYDGKIYVNVSDYAGEAGYGICVVDKHSGTYNSVSFQHGNTPASGNLILVHDKIIAYGNNTWSYRYASGDEPFCCTLGMLDTKTLETKEVDYSGDNIYLVYAFQDQLYVITSSGYIHIYDDNLSLVEKKEIQNTDFYEKFQSDAWFNNGKIVEKDDMFAMLFIGADLDAHDVGFIQEYHKSDLQPIRKIDIFLLDTSEWMGELYDLAMIE